MNATEHLIEAFRATKAGDESRECESTRKAFIAIDYHEGCALDLPALLSALAEIVVGEPCVSVPMREIEAARDAADVTYKGMDGSPGSFLRASRAIFARLPAPKVDHVAELRDLLTAAKTNAENCRARDISGAEWWDAKVAPLEAAIAKMEKP